MSHTVLFVDDDIGVLQALVRRLRKEPFEICTATSAEEAHATFARRKIDLVVCDWRMPGMCGTEFLASIAKEYPNCIRIMLTGEPTLAVAIGAVNNGEVYRFLTKPYDAEALARIIRTALGKRESAPSLNTEGLQSKQGIPAYKSSILQHVLDCVVCIDHEGGILEFNPAAEQMFGYSRAEILGKKVSEAFPACEFRDVLAGSLDTAAFMNVQGEVIGSRLESTAVRADGKKITVELVTIAARNGDNPILTSFIRDISKIKKAEAEIKSAENRMREAAKFEAIGRLAGGVARDFNHVLAAINVNCEILLTDMSLSSAIKAALREIQSAGERGAALTRQLVALSGKKESVSEVVDLNQVIIQLEPVLVNVAGPVISVVKDLSPSPARVRGSRGDIEQVVMDIVTNSCEAMPRGGELQIRVTVDRSIPPPEYGNRVQLSITDTGCGMDEPAQRRVFEPFFTTKNIDRSSGLSLSTAYGIVARQGGNIKLDTARDQGTTLTISLPLVEVESEPGVEAVKPLPVGRETVLVLEDDRIVQSLACKFLKGAGYKVLEAASAADVLAILHAQREKVDLLIAGIVMADIGGAELGAQFLKQRPEGKVILLSSYLGKTGGRDGTRGTGFPILKKPFDATTLCTTVRQVLSAPPQSARPKAPIDSLAFRKS
jgi:hypothetical protein